MNCKTKILGTALVSLGLLAGCQNIPQTQSTDPYTGEQQTNKTTKGAGIGALTGAVLGAATSSDGDRKKGIATGALVGGAIGGGVGYYMDRQEAELRRYLQGTGVQVQRQGDRIQLIMPGNITFQTGSAQLASNFYDVLNAVAVVLKKYDDTRINVDGHTDSVGDAGYNQQLSVNRANSVASHLASQGISYDRITSTGYGESRPLADNNSESGRAANRRVELWIQPAG